jgi:predicted Rossmann fold flavoprotein
MHSWDLIVIGGGAAGLWAAGTAALNGRKVLVLEKNNKAGPKILMSGGTRCNITHDCDWRRIVDAFGREGRFLSTALHHLPPSEVIRTIEAEGVATKREVTGKIFPVSDRAIDVRDALVQRMQRGGGVLHTGIAVKDVRRSNSETGFEVIGENESWSTANLLVATGGLSYPGCGTTGDGYPWLQRLGHTITPLRPALTPLVSSVPWLSDLQGITLPDAAVTVELLGDGSGKNSAKKDPRLTARGGLLWTHFGLSGPAPMNVSRAVSDLPAGHHSTLHIDLLPDQKTEQLAHWFQTVTQSGSRTLLNTLSDLLPRRIAQTMLELTQISLEKPLAEVSKKNRIDLLDKIKNFSIPLHGTRGYSKAEVTAGGVVLSEVNPQTMESKIVPGLYLAGEILNLDGPIGGFNFQAAFSTGHLVGMNVTA